MRFRNQLSDQTYRAIKRDFFRVHRQFVFGVERRSHYSYHAILCGPEPFAEVARHAGLSDDWSGFAAPRRSGRAMSLTIAGKIAWVVLVAGWYALRYPFERRAKAGRHRGRSEEIRRACSAFPSRWPGSACCRSSMW